jgi:hypothetical protein
MFVQVTRFVEAHTAQGRFAAPAAVMENRKELLEKTGEPTAAWAANAECLEFFPVSGQGPQATGALFENA